MPFHRRLACKLNYFQSIILMFAAVILIGAALLMLPISAQERTVTPFHEALFTATSAVCVTGLVVRDTASHWSITDETGAAATELTDGVLYELRVTVADGGDFDLSETEKEIKLSVVLGK